MFDIPGLDMINPFLGPAAGGGMDASGSIGSIADAASSAWDFGSNAIANIGAGFDPSIVGGGVAPAQKEIALGLMDMPSVNDATADYQQDFLY